MRVFDSLERANLNRRETQLLVLAIGTIALLAGGFAALAYPAMFPHSYVLSSWTVRVYFFGFCGLCALLIGYLWQRYQLVRRLREQVEAEQRRYTEYRRQAGQDLLGALPRFNQFQDRLIMEYKRAVNLVDTFSILVVKLTPGIHVSDEAEIAAAYGDAAKAVRGKLRREDSLFLFTTDAFGVILPGMNSAKVRRTAARLEEGIHDAAGAAERFIGVVKAFNYPENGTTARELELAVRSLLPADLVAEPLVDTPILETSDREP